MCIYIYIYICIYLYICIYNIWLCDQIVVAAVDGDVLVGLCAERIYFSYAPSSPISRHKAIYVIDLKLTHVYVYIYISSYVYRYIYIQIDIDPYVYVQV